MTGSPTYIKTNSIDGGSAIDLNASNIQVNWHKSLMNQPNPTIQAWPNSIVDDLGTLNRSWTINGFIDPEGRYSTTANHISMPILGSIALLGGSYWLYDDYLTFNFGYASGTGLAQSGAWVKLQNLQCGRQTTDGASTVRVGDKINYQIVVVESK